MWLNKIFLLLGIMMFLTGIIFFFGTGGAALNDQATGLQLTLFRLSVPLIGLGGLFAVRTGSHLAQMSRASAEPPSYMKSE
jgi:hypothetical protein